MTITFWKIVEKRVYIGNVVVCAFYILPLGSGVAWAKNLTDNFVLLKTKKMPESYPSTHHTIVVEMLLHIVRISKTTCRAHNIART